MEEPLRYRPILAAHQEAVESFFRTHSADVGRAAREMAEAVGRGGKILFFGNGGSAADAQHLAAELVNRMTRDRPAIPALALSTDTSVLTSIGNDASYDRVFERQIEALGRKGDIAVALSTSGNSSNILLALTRSRERGLRSVALLGRDGGRALHLADIPLRVDSASTARIQEVHILIGHLLCEEMESILYPVA